MNRFSSVNIIKILFKFSVLIIVFINCQDRQWSNPYDVGVDADTFRPKNFHVENINGNTIQLKWDTITQNDIEYIIEKKIENNEFKKLTRTEHNTYNDTLSSLFISYTYRMMISAANRYSAYSDTIQIKSAEDHLLWTVDAGYIAHTAFFTTDNKKIVTGDNGGAIRIWDADNGSLLLTVWHSWYITSVCISSDNRKLVSGGIDSTVIVWNADNGSMIWMGEHEEELGPVNISQDNSKVVSASWDGIVKV